MKTFWLCFVPLFVAVDAFGVLPMFMGLTQGIADPIRRRVVYISVGTAAAVALAFIAAGAAVLDLLGATLADFMVAGGVLLFIIAMSDLLSDDKRQRRVDPESIGAVPLGVPLITGPAVLTTSLLLLREHGPVPTVAAVLLNIVIVGVVFLFAGGITRLLGATGAKVISKIASLLLAAIAVMMVRKGVFILIRLASNS